MGLGRKRAKEGRLHVESEGGGQREGSHTREPDRGERWTEDRGMGLARKDTLANTREKRKEKNDKRGK